MESACSFRGDDVPFVVLGAYTVSRRDFTRDDLQFMQAVANVLALAHRRHRMERAREQRAALLSRRRSGSTTS